MNPEPRYQLWVFVTTRGEGKSAAGSLQACPIVETLPRRFRPDGPQGRRFRSDTRGAAPPLGERVVEWASPSEQRSQYRPQGYWTPPASLALRWERPTLERRAQQRARREDAPASGGRPVGLSRTCLFHGRLRPTRRLSRAPPVARRLHALVELSAARSWARPTPE